MVIETRFKRLVLEMQQQLEFGMTLQCVISRNSDEIEFFMSNNGVKKGIVTHQRMVDELGVNLRSYRTALYRSRKGRDTLGVQSLAVVTNKVLESNRYKRPAVTGLETAITQEHFVKDIRHLSDEDLRVIEARTCFTFNESNTLKRADFMTETSSQLIFKGYKFGENPESDFRTLKFKMCESKFI